MAIGDDELARSNKKYRAKLAALEQELQNAEITVQQARERVGKLEVSDIKKVWDKMELEAKKRALALFIEQVVVYPGKKGNNKIVIDWRE